VGEAEKIRGSLVLLSSSPFARIPGTSGVTGLSRRLGLGNAAIFDEVPGNRLLVDSNLIFAKSTTYEVEFSSLFRVDCGPNRVYYSQGIV
jgi:hypothetical protein